MLQEGILNKLNKRDLEGASPANIITQDDEGNKINFILEDDLKTIRINKVLEVDIYAPNVKELAPVMEIFLYKGSGPKKELLSVGNITLTKPLSYYYGIEDNMDYRKRWNEFLKLGSAGLMGGDGDENPDVKPKVPRVHAQNKMNYFGINYVVQMPDPKAAVANNTINAQNENEQVQIKVGMVTEMQTNFDAENEDTVNVTIEQIGLPQPVRVDSERDVELLEVKQNNNPFLAVGGTSRTDDMKTSAMIKEWKEKNQQPVAYGHTVKKNVNLRQQIVQIKKKRTQKLDGSNYIDESDDEQEMTEGIKNAAKEFDIDLPEDQNNQEQDNISHDFLEDLKVERQNFSIDSDEIDAFNNDMLNEELEDLQIGTNKIPKMDSEISSKAVKYADEFVTENPDAIKKRRKDERNKFLSKFKMRGGFRSLFKKLKKRDVEYIDFDTDEDEEGLDEVLAFLKGRYQYNDDLEDMLYPAHKIRNIEKVQMFRGSQRASAKSILKDIFGIKEEAYHQQGEFKVAFYRDEDKVFNSTKITNFMNKLMKTRKYTVRAYILKGVKVSGITVDDESVKTSIVVSMNGRSANVETGENKVRQGFYPEYYRAFEFNETQMPGTATLKIEIWEKTLISKVLLGVCEIDLEDRLLNSKWNSFEMKPVENRSIVNEIHGVRGRLEMWIDIFAEGDKKPMVPIYPIERVPFELRAILWKTTACVIKGTLTGANDTFARGGVMRGNQFLETDTHWRCRNDGSFNYRWKFDITLPVEEERNYGEDKFKLQIWDRDLIMPNDLIGEHEINLNMHNMLKKAYKRREPVEMRMKIKGTGVDTNQLLFNVFHPEVVDDITGDKVSQGKALMSFEVLPKENAEKLDNGFGRAEPNFYPTLPGPIGRFSFDFFSPCSMIKEIIGPKMCYRICYCFWCITCCAICIFFGYYIFTNYLGVKLATIF